MLSPSLHPDDLVSPRDVGTCINFHLFCGLGAERRAERRRGAALARNGWQCYVVVMARLGSLREAAQNPDTSFPSPTTLVNAATSATNSRLELESVENHGARQ